MANLLILTYLGIRNGHCDGGKETRIPTNYGMDDLKNLERNKKQGGKRTSPQETPKMLKKVVNEGKLFKFTQCDFHGFISNKVFFKGSCCAPHYWSLKMYCKSLHREKKPETKSPLNAGLKKRPCRFFKNGEEECMPPSGHCNFDQTVVPDAEREHCFHKLTSLCRQAKLYFLRPKGQR